MRVGVAAAIALAIITFFHVVFGELVPRGAALSHPENVARWLTPPLLAFAWVFDAVRQLAQQDRRRSCCTRVGQRAANPEENVHSPEELRMLVEQSQEVGVLQTQDADMLEGVFEFSEKNAREVMTPRTDIDALPIEATLDETLALVEESGRSRYPVYEETIDNIIGLGAGQGSDSGAALVRRTTSRSRHIMRPVHVVPGSREVEEVLADFKRQKEHMAIVLDEYGGTAGTRDDGGSARGDRRRDPRRIRRAARAHRARTAPIWSWCRAARTSAS